MNEPQLRPFKPLGKRLKALRDKAQETLAEASEAVEIDVKQLASFELGQSRPTEDVLLLLISHFGTKDDEAVRMWEMAGYGSSRSPAMHLANQDAEFQTDLDQPILFTDIVDVVVNKYGVVMHFLQNSVPGSKPNAVARVGMSREHAKSVLRILQMTLERTEKNVETADKFIPSDNSSTEDSRKN